MNGMKSGMRSIGVMMYAIAPKTSSLSTSRDTRIGDEAEQQTYEVRQLSDVVKHGALCACARPTASRRSRSAIVERSAVRTSACRRCHQSFSSPLPGIFVSCAGDDASVVAAAFVAVPLPEAAMLLQVSSDSLCVDFESR